LDSGGGLNAVLIDSLLVSLDLIVHKWGPANMQERLRGLTNLMADTLARFLGTRVRILPKSERCGHILGVRLAEEDGEEVANTLRALCESLCEHGVLVSVRGCCLRISPYLFNTSKEVLCFCSLFTQLLLATSPGPRLREYYTIKVRIFQGPLLLITLF